jgi:hypothetical protein
MAKKRKRGAAAAKKTVQAAAMEAEKKVPKSFVFRRGKGTREARQPALALTGLFRCLSAQWVQL